MKAYTKNPNWFKENNLTELEAEIYNVTSFLDGYTQTFSERMYCILNDIFDIRKCNCGNICIFKRYGLGYNEYCSVKCRANSKKWLNQVKETRKEKYGVEHIAQLPDEKIKRSKAFKKRRPTMDFSQANEKRKKTLEKRYGINYNSGWNDKAIKTRILNENMIAPEFRDKYKQYYQKVVTCTRNQPVEQLDNIDKRGVMGINKNPYHIDHIYPIYHGFLNDICPTIIGHISNLQCIPATENITKGNDITLTITEVYDRYNKWEKNLTT